MKYDYEDCFDEVEYIETDFKVDIDDKVLKNIQKNKQKIKRQNKKIKNKINED